MSSEIERFLDLMVEDPRRAARELDGKDAVFCITLGREAGGTMAGWAIDHVIELRRELLAGRQRQREAMETDNPDK